MTRMERKTAADFDPEVLRLFDRYVHGLIDRRGFLEGAGKYAAAGTTAVGLLEALSPRYAEAQQVPGNDARIRGEYVYYESPQGHGKMRGYLVRPANATGRLPGVLVVHENRGLNPHIEDVARRAALANFVAFAPDALTPLGGYPGTDEQGVEMQRKLDQPKVMNDFEAATRWLQSHDATTDRVGVVGFCFGGSVSNNLAVRVPTLAAAVPFYGGQARAEDVPRINAALLIHYAENDQRINAGWPAYEAALKANGKTYTMHMYPGTQHGFHNDTTPRFDAEAAKLAWDRTIAFFNQHLR
jgi:carboxymethylenebutenolidase